MNCFDVLFFATYIACGSWLAGILHPLGGYWLSIPGFVAGFLVIPTLLRAYWRYDHRVYFRDQPMPPCICGSEGYTVEFVCDMDFHEVCQSCGKRYEKRKRGQEVYLIEEEERIPYMHLVKHQGWVEMDKDPPP